MINKIEPSKFSFYNRQAKSLRKSHLVKDSEVNFHGLKIKVFGGVYKTSDDTELMVENIEIKQGQTFLEIGCGTGVISIILAKTAKSGVGCDVNELAVKNSQFNAKRYNIKNVKFTKSDVFENISGKFDIVICNPPYSDYPASDDIDKMFWDKNNEMKKRFFKEVGSYLNKDGIIYFGWANFKDIDVNLPFRLAKENGLKIIDVKDKVYYRKTCTFYVFKIKKD